MAAEDTRVTRKLLSHFDIHTPLVSYHRHSLESKTESIIGRLLAGESAALVSDAGTPCVSDPGADLVTSALAVGIAVVPIPGASAVLAALAVSGLFTGRFAFDGFPPRTRADRREFFGSLAAERRTIVLYESPTRILSTLQDLRAALGDRPVAVARELTKLFEEVYRGTLDGAVAALGARKPRGEYTVVVGGARSGSGAATQESHAEPHPDAETVRTALREELHGGSSPRDAVRSVAARLALPRRYVYTILLEMPGR